MTTELAHLTSSALDRADALLLVPISATEQHDGFAGTLSIGERATEQLLAAATAALVAQLEAWR